MSWDFVVLADDITDVVLIDFLKIMKDAENVDRDADRLIFNVRLCRFSSEIVLSLLLLILCER